MSIIAKYKFDSSVYADLIPEFNSEFTSDLYTVTDEVDSENSNHIIRTIESDSLPTSVLFKNSEGVISLDYLATENITSFQEMFVNCINLTDIMADDWDTSNVIDMSYMFYGCENLTELDLSTWNTSNVTNMAYTFGNCQNLIELDLANWDTSNVTNMQSVFESCNNLTSLDVSNWNTSNVTNMNSLFYNCNNLTSLDVSNWDTSNVTDMEYMFSDCNNLTSLDVSNFDTSKVTNMKYMFAYCSNLTSLDVSNFNTSNVTTMTNMFINTNNLKYVKCNNVTTLNTLNTQLPTKSSDNQGTIICKSDTTNLDTTTLESIYWTVNTNPTLIAKYKYDSTIYKNLIPEFNEGYMGFVEDEEVDENGIVTRVIEHVELPTLMRFGDDSGSDITDRCRSLLEVLDMNTNELTTAYAMFMRNRNLTKINCNWNTSKIKDFGRMFYNCPNLKEVELEQFDVSNGTHINFMFYYCSNLPNTLDLSSWNISNVINANTLFSNCTSIQRLDISNFNVNSSANFNDAFKNTENLTDIGMIYCDQSTINKVASLLPTDHNITIWVESDDILQYDQYDHITYKTQKVQDTVHLNSPLLMGDTIEVIDGKTYHVHRYEKVVLDGSENWVQSDTGGTINIQFYTKVSDNMILTSTACNGYCDTKKVIPQVLRPYEVGQNTVWFSSGYIAFVYPLDTISLESFKQWLQENPTTVIYELATPYYELILEEPLELTLLDTADNIINNNSILPSNMTIANKELATIAIKPSTIYTLSFDKSNEDSEVTIDICSGEQITTVGNIVQLITPSELGNGIRFISSDGCIISNVRLIEGGLAEEAMSEESFEGLQSSFDDGYIIGGNLANEKEDYFYKETGDWGNQIIDFKRNLKANTTYTLVRKISDIKYGLLNGVSFYDMAYYVDGTQLQDHNCTYSKNGWYISKYTPTKDVTHFAIIIGNNNYDNGDIRPRIVISDYMIFEGDHTHLSEAELMRYIEKGTSHYEEEDFNHLGKYKVEYKVTGKNKFNGELEIGSMTSTGIPTDDTRCVRVVDYIKIKPNTAYIISNDKSYTQNVYFYDTDYNCIKTINTKNSFTTPQNCMYIKFRSNIADIQNDLSVKFQLEEGTVATEYEPYREDIKTYYLSSPFLEGDTIEDVNGVATHVKRYGKVVLDGSENWYNYNITNGYYKCGCQSFRNTLKPGNLNVYLPSDKLSYVAYNSNPDIIIGISDSLVSSLPEAVQWLQDNPSTIIYPLASPIYEPISEESILLDSYVNGHLDLSNENIPIQKTEFRNFTKELAYLQPSTDYIVRFSSDNIGIAKVYLDSSVKEINVVKGINEVIITTPSTIVNNNIIIDGIGFNVSNVQVIADVIKDGDIKDFDYFKGLQSSFEDGLVTDENDENYGKYKVECEVTGKNKLSIANYNDVSNTSKGIELDSTLFGRNLTLSFNLISKDGYNIGILGFKNNQEVYTIQFGGNVQEGYLSQNFNIPSECDRALICLATSTSGWNLNITNIQIEEGTQATEYEPYKESIYTLYLNSPLLKGDKLVIHDGKLCHYHKMDMVVLDGSENWTIINTKGNICCWRYTFNNNTQFYNWYVNIICDTFNPKMIGSYYPLTTWKHGIVMAESEYMYEGSNSILLLINDSYTAKTWLSANPTTVVYKLAEPYYEEIEPQISQYSFSTVKDGDMEIITALPIEIDLTYRTDINGVSFIEEQIASIQESTDISNIIDEEVDE